MENRCAHELKLYSKKATFEDKLPKSQTFLDIAAIFVIKAVRNLRKC